MTHISPERAKELLEGATPGPWIIGLTSGIGGIGFAEEFYRDSPRDIANVALAEAAPELAETIAEMHWEYAVQAMDEDGKWLGIDKNGLATHAYGFVVWHLSQRDARESLLDLVEQDAPTRIVRRLATAPEVVE